jgi:hypothetical protein
MRAAIGSRQSQIGGPYTHMLNIVEGMKINVEIADTLLEEAKRIARRRPCGF